LSLVFVDQVLNAPLIDIPAFGTCDPYSFHRERGAASNPIVLEPGDYLIEVFTTINGHSVLQKLEFSVETCDFIADLVMNIEL
jgi:hypothetical protein